MHSFEQINNFSCLEYDTLFHSDSDTEHKITGKREPESFVKLLSADTTRAAWKYLTKNSCSNLSRHTRKNSMHSEMKKWDRIYSIWNVKQFQMIIWKDFWWHGVKI